MARPSNIVVADIEVEGQLDGVCITDMADLVKFLNKNAKVYVPNSITNVIVSAQQPSDSERQKVWFRLDNSSSFVGIYIYSVGSWRKIYPVGKQVYWLVGDSRDVPDGYALIDDGIGGFTSSEIDRIKALYTSGETNDYYTYFAVVYKGF